LESTETSGSFDSSTYPSSSVSPASASFKALLYAMKNSDSVTIKMKRIYLYQYLLTAVSETNVESNGSSWTEGTCL
jgi:hypothetical protein